MYRIFLCACLNIILAVLSYSQTVAPETRPMMTEMYRIRVINVQDGTIEASENRGKTWATIGRVLLPASIVSNQGYTASKWIDDGDVAAVAVNAIHIKTDYNTADDKGIIFSLLPKENYAADPKMRTTPEAAIYTDIKAGQGIFGGEYSPLVGNIVSQADYAGNLYPIKKGFVPRVGDSLVIKVERPARYPREIVFENRFGGLITIRYADNEERYIGQVLRPIEGVGRFLGSEFSDVGRIRANHAGVICIATSPIGFIGGFQIIPAGHGMSKEMITARTLTQWMVIGPVSALDASFEGTAPFFKYYLQPKYGEDDIERSDWEKRLLERFLVEVKYKGREGWQMMPVYYMSLSKALPKWASTAMEDISHIRILFPVYREGKT